MTHETFVKVLRPFCNLFLCTDICRYRESPVRGCTGSRTQYGALYFRDHHQLAAAQGGFVGDDTGQ